MEETSMQIIGYVHTDFPTKFGLPRQSGLIEELVGAHRIGAGISPC